MIVKGIIERYLPAESKISIADTTPETLLAEDLGIDSLTMLEIVLSIEEALGFRIEDSELRNIRTMGDVTTFINKKISGEPTETASSAVVKKYDRDKIALIVPQQPPFLFIDEATIEGDSLTASYLLKGDELFFDGHFKDNPVVPAAIVFEALGQACCLWVLDEGAKRLDHPVASNEVVFASLDGASFHKRAKPGDRLDFEAKLLRLRAPVALFEGVVKVNGAKVAKINKLILAFGDIESLEKAAEAADAEEAAAVPAAA
ncbi:phosphopantetheine-binding protein [Verrucomicrobium sp. GAS474]|uniref:phosphopantetheine-binding protein n=1 Tax=Verrucomicrobium sp. GAS474 TaxID=1882831 RepID=UPI00139045CA|nr:phosphopantetheine-binding protein [Verrucomicrobium sp. GAS474]